MDLSGCTLLVIVCTAAAVTYKGAVVERPVVDNPNYALRKELTANATVALAAEAAQTGAHIIVFPEYGLIGFPTYPYSPTKKAAYADLFDEIPEPTGDVPCLNPANYANAPTIVALSCGAKDNNIAIVGCLGDIVKCPNTAYPGCAQPGQDGLLQFNTAVAFDNDGKFLLKYHKTNFWGEDDYLDVPQGCEDKTFTTSFGVTFGLVICADIIYEFPPERLVQNGVTNFISPIWWDNSMAHMQAMPWHQGWSLRNCANVLIANYGPFASGSGIFSCGKVKASYYKSPSTVEIIYAELDSDPATKPASALVPSLSTSDTGPQGWQFASLASGQVCSGQICCVASDIVGSPSGYSIAALSGLDSGCGDYTLGHDCGKASLHWPGEACGVFSCTAPNTACLNYQTPTGSLTGVRLEMVVSPGTAVYPHVLVHNSADASTEQLLLEPGADGLDFLQTDTSAVLSVSSQHPITSAEVYGRSYGQDTLSYSCPLPTTTPAGSTPLPTSAGPTIPESGPAGTTTVIYTAAVEFDSDGAVSRSLAGLSLRMCLFVAHLVCQQLRV
jgi:predicted amidohydrolase